jgi:hypothetical protein
MAIFQSGASQPSRSATFNYRVIPIEIRIAVMKWINSELKEACGLEYDITVSERTAWNWLVKLNFNFEKYKQGSAYVDCYERPDVVAHRNRFFSEMETNKQGGVIRRRPDGNCHFPMNTEGKRVVLVTQNECIFQAHDGRKRIWQDTSRKTLRPKGEGLQ